LATREGAFVKWIADEALMKRRDHAPELAVGEVCLHTIHKVTHDGDLIVLTGHLMVEAEIAIVIPVMGVG